MLRKYRVDRAVAFLHAAAPNWFAAAGWTGLRRTTRRDKMIHRSVGTALCALVLAALSAGAQTRDDLLAGFRTVPQEARPRVWWHWMNANITKSGIEKDLDWFKRVGI